MMNQEDKDLQQRTLDAMCVNSSKVETPFWHNIKYLLMGTMFGIIFSKAEVISWFRIQEMFRLESFHMYGVIGSAILTAMISLQIIKKFNIKSFQGEEIKLTPKKFNKGNVYGGLIFGLGWTMTGACPGPLFAQIGTGTTVIVITLLSAVFGTWVYGKFRDKLPH